MTDWKITCKMIQGKTLHQMVRGGENHKKRLCRDRKLEAQDRNEQKRFGEGTYLAAEWCSLMLMLLMVI